MQWDKKNGKFYLLIVIMFTIIFYPATIIWIVPFPKREDSQFQFLPLVYHFAPASNSFSFLWLQDHPLVSVCNSTSIFMIKPSPIFHSTQSVILPWPLSESCNWTIHHSFSDLVFYLLFAILSLTSRMENKYIENRSDAFYAFCIF